MKSRCFCHVVLISAWTLMPCLPSESGAGQLTNTVPIGKDLYFQLTKEFGPPTNRFSATEPIYYSIESFISSELSNRNIFYRYFPPEE
ncbi:MAG: hypothetical protein RLZZ303_2595, partial [Candidatus Hydrogenedentota bacterium]